ncbi:MAG: transcription termination factor NusA [Candidatus Competibacterales bacterium]|nr:transcription termination factor NusA [Candidatus Competibacterales bacterium]
MSKEILQVADAVSNEKGVGREVIFEAIEAALASAAKKRFEEDAEIRVTIDRRTGNYTTYRRWQVGLPEEVAEHPGAVLTVDQALELKPDAAPGDVVEIEVPNADFGRIAAQTAKQVIVQKVREAERAQVVEAYIDRKGELVNGVVKRLERGNVYIDLGGSVEAFIPREELIPREPIRIGERLRGYLKDVRSEPRGPQLFVSRVAPELLIELFRIEVPEIGQGLIEIKGAARDPGARAKIAVKSNDMRIDPVGACVGMRGSRVQNVSNELHGERVDIVLWDANPAQYVINAMSPAEVISIVVDEDSHSMDIAVDEDKLSQAIGRGGQNVRLASELTGWELNVMTEEQAQEKSVQEADALLQMFVDELGVDDEIAEILVREGFASIEEVAYVPAHEMMEIEEFDEDVVEALRERARDVLLTRAIAEEEGIGESPQEDLLTMEGMDEDLAYRLAGRGVKTMEDLAELSVDDLTEITGIDDQRAASLIMTARAPWFESED